jgi:hypothetical protein
MERILNGVYKYFIRVLVLGLLISGGQTTPTQENCDGYRFGSGHPEYPDYIYQVWPVPGGVFSRACYQASFNDYDPEYRGVGVNLYRRDIDTQFSDGSTPLEPRVKLYIDGSLVPGDSGIGSEAGEILPLNMKSYNPPITAQYWMSWAPELGVGEHEAKIEITRDNGEVLEYSWSFKITRR